MRRELFEWRGTKIHAYTAMLYLGIVFGVIGGTFASTLHGLAPGPVYALMLVLVLPALLGARLLFVASNWGLYRGEPARIWRRADSGAALYGGLIVSFLLSLPLLRALGISVGEFWDATIVTMLIGMVFTKIGCLLNGCCGGRPTESRLGLHLPNEHGVWCRRVPAQLLEGGLACILLLGAVRFWNQLPFAGACFLGVTAAYGAGRWWIESIRDTADTVGSIRVHRAISAALVVLSTTTLVILWLHKS
jgi:phosphatidylglycerol---prolipoprotein diacylglyceryl transferase